MTRYRPRCMSDSDEQDLGLSRRDFVQGRFWRALRLSAGSRRAADMHSVDNLRTVPLVVRYPKSSADISAAESTSTESPSAKSCTPMSLLNAPAARRRTIPILRPPGAINEVDFLAECTRCNRCIEACPHDAIAHAPARLREAMGTPMLDPDRSPCRMCDDFPCISACEPNVLSRLVPVMIGTAKVTAHLCIAYHGTTCTVCSERCPVEGAIEVQQGKPTIKEDLCTGCGVCRYVCPAPENAILLMPTFSRPLPPKPTKTTPLKAATDDR